MLLAQPSAGSRMAETGPGNAGRLCCSRTRWRWSFSGPRPDLFEVHDVPLKISHMARRCSRWSRTARTRSDHGGQSLAVVKVIPLTTVSPTAGVARNPWARVRDAISLKMEVLRICVPIARARTLLLRPIPSWDAHNDIVPAGDVCAACAMELGSKMTAATFVHCILHTSFSCE
jgi:hypothetical protein